MGPGRNPDEISPVNEPLDKMVWATPEKRSVSIWMHLFSLYVWVLALRYLSETTLLIPEWSVQWVISPAPAYVGFEQFRKNLPAVAK